MLSILIPTYNVSSLSLVTAIHSQAEQTQIPFEILIFDDGSPNPSEENKQINELKFASYTKRTKNIGRSAIRNLLAEKARFETLLFLDADVLPKRLDFIQNYVSRLQEAVDVIAGGIVYAEGKPPKKSMLRYCYGKARESRSVAQRNQQAHIVVSANLCIKKTLFLKINTLEENSYGDDLVLSQQLKNLQINVLHIDNPVIHLGLETSEVFINKSFEALETIVHLEEKGELENNTTTLQQAYLRAKKKGVLPLIRVLVFLINPIIKVNLGSTHPSLFLFDLYRLNHYIKLKKHA